MKKLYILMLFAVVASVCTAQQVCRLGFDYEISTNKNWGTGKPVVTEVTPYTGAETAGLKVNDIILAIDNVPVGDVTPPEIADLLNRGDTDQIILMVSNLADTAKVVRMRRDCKPANAITEEQLASAFSFYSLENTSERLIVFPFKTVVTQKNNDFLQYRSFDFAPVDEANQALEQGINSVIEKCLIDKGMKRDVISPALVVQTFYFFDKNPNYRATAKPLTEKEPVYRFNYLQNKMERVPFLSNYTVSTDAIYLMQLGVRIIEKKSGDVLWECEANEMLEQPYNLEKYAANHIPIMLLQYPYVKYEQNVPVMFNHKAYNYTGIHYSIDNLQQVVSIDPNSPASIAGIQPNDQIGEIDGKKLSGSTDELTSAYRQFITNTMKLRDSETLFTDANGFTRCMYWDVKKYAQVASAIRRNSNQAVFAYLYKFEPYVEPSGGNNASTFQLVKGKNKTNVVIRPTIRTQMVISVY